MRAQRPETDRDTGEAVERMWQLYADEIGIPKATPAASNEPLPRQRPDMMQGPRPVRVMAEGAGRFLAAVGVVVVAVIVGSAFWLQFSSFPHTGDRPTTLVSAPAGEADRLAPSPQPPSSTIPGSDTTPASATRPVETTQDSTTVMPRISFDFGSEGINAESRRALDTIVVAMNANPDWRVAIEGHTDAQGTPDYNRALSERRAQAVRAYLQQAGIARERLSVAGFGASRPVARNDAAGKVLNRRVELHRQ